MESSVPLPETEDEIRAEHERQQAREASESFASGHAEWEGVASAEPRGDEALAEQLEAEGLPVAALDVPARGGGESRRRRGARNGFAPSPPRARRSRSSPAAAWSGRSCRTTRSPSSAASGPDRLRPVG